MRLSLLIPALLGLLLLLPAPGARAQDDAAEIEVDLELLLAVDVSRSMDIEELRIQRAGYIAALRDPQVHAAITRGLLGRIAVTYVEWAGAGKREQLTRWTLLDGPEAALDFAESLTFPPIQAATGTSISDILRWGADEMDRNRFRGLRRVIDVSGDGPNNTGPRVQAMRDRAVAAGVTVNGLPLMMKAYDGPFSLRRLDLYYEDCVIGGPNSFLLPVHDMADFAETIRRKIILEIARMVPAAPPRVVPAQLGLGALNPRKPRIDCLIGEKLRERWMREGGWE